MKMKSHVPVDFMFGYNNYQRTACPAHLKPLVKIVPIQEPVYSKQKSRDGSTLISYRDDYNMAALDAYLRSRNGLSYKLYIYTEEGQIFKFPNKVYHVSTRFNLKELVPYKGRIYFTTPEHVAYWARHVATKQNYINEVAVYEIDLSTIPKLNIGTGMDGSDRGDYYLQTLSPVKVQQVDWDFRKARPKKTHRNKYRP